MVQFSSPQILLQCIYFQGQLLEGGHFSVIIERTGSPEVLRVATRDTITE